MAMLDRQHSNILEITIRFMLPSGINGIKRLFEPFLVEQEAVLFPDLPAAFRVCICLANVVSLSLSQVRAKSTEGSNGIHKANAREDIKWKPSLKLRGLSIPDWILGSAVLACNDATGDEVSSGSFYDRAPWLVPVFWDLSARDSAAAPSHCLLQNQIDGVSSLLWQELMQKWHRLLIPKTLTEMTISSTRDGRSNTTFRDQPQKQNEFKGIRWAGR
uniref:Uncharacterized protein LOC110208948 n=1 Tax=Phascolarctos cinereus TaxID=38626 RepID=A0A6P5KBF9_PHACI|nr:uncharacterized protein LOC110208948 [Phascolarctos cinereus]